MGQPCQTMKREKFACHACGERTVQSDGERARCTTCKSEYEASMAAVAKVAAIAPLSFLVASLTGAWWIWLLVVPAGVYVAVQFDRKGRKWRITHTS